MPQAALEPGPKWVIDLHGMREALTTSSNSARVAIIDAIQAGEMLIVRSVSDGIKDLYPDLWEDFKAITPRKYAHSTGATIDAATHLMERYGSSLLGSIPTFETFEALAIARLKKCKLISGGKALADCTKIATKCGLPPASVAAITSV